MLTVDEVRGRVVVGAHHRHHRHAGREHLEACGAEPDALEVVAFDVGRGRVLRDLVLGDLADCDERVVDAERLGALEEAVVVDLADDDHDQLGYFAQQVGHRLDEREAVAERDDVADREDHRPVADPELLADRAAVGREETVGLDADRDVDEVVAADAVALRDVLLHEDVDRDDVRVADAHERADEHVVGDGHQPVVPLEGAAQDRVHGQDAGYVAAACPQRAHPREVEELAVLVDDVGPEVVEDLEQAPAVLRRRGEQQVVVERELRGQRGARQPNDAEAVALLFVGSTPVRGGEQQHLVARGRDLLGEGVAHVGAAAPRREEAVHHRHPHPEIVPKRRGGASRRHGAPATYVSSSFTR